MSENKKNSVVKTAVKVWLRLLLASIMCFIVWLSIDAMGLAAFGEVTGYEIYAYDENGENPQLVTKYIYTAEDDRSAEIEVKDNELLTYNREMPVHTEAIIGIVSSIFTLLIFGLFPYNMLWDIGSHDDNFVQLGRMDEDKHFGLKVGIIASIPSTLLYLLLIMGKFGVINGIILKWHRLLNTAFIPYIDAVEMGADYAAELSVGSLLAVAVILLFVPFVCWLGYYLGYRQISMREKLVYKKKTNEKR